jgi:hypothetical protein
MVIVVYIDRLAKLDKSLPGARLGLETIFMKASVADVFRE